MEEIPHEGFGGGGGGTRMGAEMYRGITSGCSNWGGVSEVDGVNLRYLIENIYIAPKTVSREIHKLDYKRTIHGI